jgi:hypothetical protein
MRISIEGCGAAPHWQKNDSDTNGSDSEMQRFESSRPELRVFASFDSEMQSFESCRPNQPVRL